MPRSSRFHLGFASPSPLPGTDAGLEGLLLERGVQGRVEPPIVLEPFEEDDGTLRTVMNATHAKIAVFPSMLQPLGCSAPTTAGTFPDAEIAGRAALAEHPHAIAPANEAVESQNLQNPGQRRVPFRRGDLSRGPAVRGTRARSELRDRPGYVDYLPREAALESIQPPADSRREDAGHVRTGRTEGVCPDHGESPITKHESGKTVRVAGIELVGRHKHRPPGIPSRPKVPDEILHRRRRLQKVRRVAEDDEPRPGGELRRPAVLDGEDLAGDSASHQFAEELRDDPGSADAGKKENGDGRPPVGSFVAGRAHG